MTMTESFKKATENFKEADEKFQELMKTVNNRLIEINSGTTSDNRELKCKDNKELGLFDKVALELREIENEENIIRPNHYASDKGFEVFDVQEAFIHELKGMAASYWCNIVKYILRFQKKNGVEDLKKAKYYLEKLIEEELKK